MKCPLHYNQREDKNSNLFLTKEITQIQLLNLMLQSSNFIEQCKHIALKFLLQYNNKLILTNS